MSDQENNQLTAAAITIAVVIILALLYMLATNLNVVLAPVPVEAYHA